MIRSSCSARRPPKRLTRHCGVLIPRNPPARKLALPVCGEVLVEPAAVRRVLDHVTALGVAPHPFCVTVQKNLVRTALVRVGRLAADVTMGTAHPHDPGDSITGDDRLR